MSYRSRLDDTLTDPAVRRGWALGGAIGISVAVGFFVALWVVTGNAFFFIGADLEGFGVWVMLWLLRRSDL